MAYIIKTTDNYYVSTITDTPAIGQVPLYFDDPKEAKVIVDGLNMASNFALNPKTYQVIEVTERVVVFDGNEITDKLEYASTVVTNESDNVLSHEVETEDEE